MLLLNLFLMLPLTSALHGNPIRHVDVAVIGAGLSGLSASRDISNAGRSFVVFEARDRVGGRVLNAPVPNNGGGVQELGAEFVGPTQDRALALIKELNLTTYQTYSAGNNLLYRNGTLIPYSANDGNLPPVQPAALEELKGLLQLLDEMASGISVDAPWEHPNASAWDSVTLGTFIESQVKTADALFLIKTAVNTVLSTEMHEPSLLYFLAYIAAAGNETTPGTMQRLLGVRDGAQDSRLIGGTQLLAFGLAKKLEPRNLYLNNPVRKMARKGSKWLVKSDNQSVLADHVIIAMSPPLASRIIYDPPLAAGRDQLTQRMPMGSIGKVIALYEKPWWRETGLNAQVVSDHGVIHSTFDNSPADASFGAIMGFIEADEMRRLDQMSQKDAIQLVKDNLVTYFGPVAHNTTSMLLQRWDREVYSRGGPVAYAPPGVLSNYGPYLKQPIDNIHFAGTETSPFWTGYMDGAIRSGERAAREVLSTIRGSSAV